jgi:hypothetical protein
MISDQNIWNIVTDAHTTKLAYRTRDEKRSCGGTNAIERPA